MGRLLLIRSIAVFAVLFIALWVYLPTATLMQQSWLGYLCALVIFLSISQWLLIRRNIPATAQLLYQFGSDVIVVSILVFITGGFYSPFILLFGLVIVASGIHTTVLPVALVSVAACTGYLIAIYTFSWIHREQLPPEATLQLLLQVSILLLVGGIISAIAKRQAGLTRKTDRAVRQHQNLQRMHNQVMSSMSEGMVVLDQSLRIQDYNEAAHHLLHAQGTIGLPIHSIKHLPPSLIQFLEKKSSHNFQCEWQSTELTFLINASPLLENSDLACWLITFVDISKMKSLETRLIEQNKLAAMGRMTAMLAHELRNPIHTMGHAIELLDKVSEERQKNIQRIVHEEILRLNRLITDMLNYTRPFRPKHGSCNPRLVLATSLAQEDIEGLHDVRTHCTLESLHEDKDHLRLIVDNLLRNAIQASPKRSSVSIELHTLTEQRWQLRIIDHGKGIADELKDSLFEPFASLNPGGTGLGLATVWQVCQANNWLISHKRSQSKTIFEVEGSIRHEETVHVDSTVEYSEVNHG